MNFNFQKSLDQFTSSLEDAFPRIIGALAILVIGWWVSNMLVKLIRRGMMRGRADVGIVSFLCSLFKAIFEIIVCITAASQLNINLNTIVAAIGAAGVTAGLALKDNLANISGGAQIIFTKPFRGGDYIALQNVEGTVERIEIMFTTLRTFDNKEIVIPNSKITESIITNYSAMATRRLDLNYLVSYSEDLTKVKQVLSVLVEENAMALKEPSPMIVVGEHRESGILVGVKVWCRTEDYWTLYFEMQEKVKEAFDAAGINIPFRQLDVHMNTAD